MGSVTIIIGSGGGGSGENSVSDYDDYLQAVYDMDDSTGSTIGDAHGAYDLTLQAGSPSFGETGKNGNSVEFDATSYFTRSFGGGFGWSTEDFLISVWFKSPDNTSSRNIISVNADPTVGSTNEFAMRISTSIGGVLSGKFNSTFFDSLDLDHGVWNNAIISRRGSAAADEDLARFYLFINGMSFEASTTGAAADFSAVSRSFCIGRSGSEQADGIQFDQTRIYTRSGSPLFTTRGDLARFAVDMWNSGNGVFSFT